MNGILIKIGLKHIYQKYKTIRIGINYKNFKTQIVIIL